MEKDRLQGGKTTEDKGAHKEMRQPYGKSVRHSLSSCAKKGRMKEGSQIIINQTVNSLRKKQLVN